MRAFSFLAMAFLAISFATPNFQKKAGKAKAKPHITYATVKPIFQKNCVSCHSGPNPKHSLDLSTYPSIMKGDKEGKVVIPKNSAGSRLCKAIGHKAGATAMPPMKSLTPTAVRSIIEWVEAGCPND